MSPAGEPDLDKVKRAIPNGIPPPKRELELPETPDIITRNAIALNEENPNPRLKFIMDNMMGHMHSFVKETGITTDEWMNTIQFLTRTGKTCTDIRQEFILLSDVLGISALVDALNNPPIAGSTQSTVLGPFFTEDAAEIPHGDSIASEGKGEYLLVTGRILDTSGNAIKGALIETWETDEFGFYDTQYHERDVPDCRGRMKSGDEGKYCFRAVVPVAYPIPGDGPVGELLQKMHRHNMRPAHLHMMIQANGFHTLVTSFYPEGDKFMNSDAVFGVKKSLVVKLQEITSDEEAKKRGFKKGPFKLLEQDIVIPTLKEAADAREKILAEHSKESKRA